MSGIEVGIVIFGVMLTAQERFVKMRTSAGEWVMAAVLGSALLVLLTRSALLTPDWHTARANSGDLPVVESQHATAIGQALAGVRTDKLDEQETHLRNGMSGYLFPFEIASVHLLVVLIGAGYLARAKKRARSGNE